MKEQMIHLQIRGEKKDYPLGTTYIELAEEYQQYYEEDIVLVLLNNRLRELSKTVETDGVVEFVTTGNRIGKKAYRRSVLLLMQKAVHNLYGEQGVTVRIMHSIGQGNYCELRGDMDVTQEVVLKLKMEMMRLCDANLPIEKRNMNTDEAVALFGRLGMRDKERLFGYRRSSRVNIYELDHYKDYFYGYMVPSLTYCPIKKDSCCYIRERTRKSLMRSCHPNNCIRPCRKLPHGGKRWESELWEL